MNELKQLEKPALLIGALVFGLPIIKQLSNKQSFAIAQKTEAERSKYDVRCVKGNTPRWMKGIGCNGYNVFKQLGLLNGPLNQLLAAHAATYADKYFANMQVRFKVLVSPYHIPGGKQRKVVVKWLVGYRVCVQRAYASVAAARHVYTHNKILGRVEHGILAH